MNNSHEVLFSTTSLMPKNWTRSVAGMQNRYGLMDKLVFEACVLANRENKCV